MKPGWKTTEFWLTLIALLVAGGAFIAGAVGGEESSIGKAIAFAASALAGLGYSWSRGAVKEAEAKKEAVAIANGAKVSDEKKTSP